jgi:hypothetical protein
MPAAVRMLILLMLNAPVVAAKSFTLTLALRISWELSLLAKTGGHAGNHKYRQECSYYQYHNYASHYFSPPFPKNKNRPQDHSQVLSSRLHHWLPPPQVPTSRD